VRGSCCGCDDGGDDYDDDDDGGDDYDDDDDGGDDYDDDDDDRDDDDDDDDEYIRVDDPSDAGGYEEAVVEVEPPPISQMTAEEARKRRWGVMKRDV